MTFEQKHFHDIDKIKRMIRMADIVLAKGDLEDSLSFLYLASYRMESLIEKRDQDDERK